jgi:hypothetical protein
METIWKSARRIASKLADVICGVRVEKVLNEGRWGKKYRVRGLGWVKVYCWHYSPERREVILKCDDGFLTYEKLQGRDEKGRYWQGEWRKL